MRTPSSRSRIRPPAVILALLVLAAAAWIASTGLARATTSTNGHHVAKLVLKSHDPATVTGTGFKPQARVRVTLVAAQTFVRRPVTSSLGAFSTTFPTVVDRCSGYSVSASQPGRATVVLRGPAKPECAPASMP